MGVNISQFLDVTLALSNLLGIKFISGQNLHQFYIGKVVQRAFQCQAAGRMDEFSWLTSLLIALRKDLAIVANRSPALLRQLRKKLCSGDMGTYAGARTELYLAAKLLRAGIVFGKQESPDFAVSGFSEPVHLECTSSHFSKTVPPGDYAYKFESAIRAKTLKHYRKENLILVCDGTNVFHYGQPWKKGSAFAHFRNRVRASLVRSDFQCMLLLCFINDTASEQFGYTYNHIGRSGLSPAVRKFLTIAFPSRRRKVFHFQIPRFA